MINQILLIAHLLIAFAIIGLVLIQHGKGAEAGAAFGGSASQTVFGSQGSASFLTKLTALLAVCFAFTSISLNYVANKKSAPQSVMESYQVNQGLEVPAVPSTEQVDPATNPNSNSKD
jgi:preprotein translocase subunit SecG